MNLRGGEGAEIVYSLRNNSTLADLSLNNIGEKGQIKRKTYQRRLPENPNKDYYYILRETEKTEPLLVEYGFIDNQNDSIKLKNNLEDYVEGVVKAIAEYTNTPYNEQNSEIAKEYYIVQKGDTLYSISKKFNIPVERLKEINNLTNNTLTINQKLYLEKPKDTNNEIYIVEKGDTLYSISKKFNIPIEELKNINNLTSNTLSIGQKLLLKKDENNISEDYSIYTIQKGDSLWKISKKYNITVPELIEINNLDNLTIQIGQKLLVPQQEIKEDIYIVEKGDTLWSVAKKNNLTVDELKELNNLDSTLLSIGQILKISK